MSWIGIGWGEIKKLRKRNFFLHFFPVHDLEKTRDERGVDPSLKNYCNGVTALPEIFCIATTPGSNVGNARVFSCTGRYRVLSYR
jgi:hypothetical protein